MYAHTIGACDLSGVLGSDERLLAKLRACVWKINVPFTAAVEATQTGTDMRTFPRCKTNETTHDVGRLDHMVGHYTRVGESSLAIDVLCG